MEKHHPKPHEGKTRIRRNIYELQEGYKQGDPVLKAELENLIRAWVAIQDPKRYPIDNKNSYFKIAGYHGEPFRGAGWGVGNPTFWGGYCHHGNILFPLWHRAYMLSVEQALQSVDGCKDVMMPYWDETSEESLRNGIPEILTQETFCLDGKNIPNPLFSYTFPQNIVDNTVGGQDLNYTKLKGYKTVRYPKAGLVGTEQDIANTEAHNAQHQNHDENTQSLNQNIKAWLSPILPAKDIPNGVPKPSRGIYGEYRRCLEAPNYTVFSNVTSSTEWNQTHDTETIQIPIESPHNHIHLAVGGFTAPPQPDSNVKIVSPPEIEPEPIKIETFEYDPVYGANGDMGENETASFDPIFFFHHANVDRVFWLWQRKHEKLEDFDIIDGYPGTNSSDSQGATPGIAPNTWLSLDTPLEPFKKKDGKTPITGRDMIKLISEEYEYTYSRGSLEEFAVPVKAKVSAYAQGEPTHQKKLAVNGINRAGLRGSFIIEAYSEVNGGYVFLGAKSVLSRWNVSTCKNCQNHLETRAIFDLEGVGLPDECLKTGQNAKNFAIVRMREAPRGKVAAFVHDTAVKVGEVAQEHLKMAISPIVYSTRPKSMRVNATVI